MSKPCGVQWIDLDTAEYRRFQNILGSSRCSPQKQFQDSKKVHGKAGKGRNSWLGAPISSTHPGGEWLSSSQLDLRCSQWLPGFMAHPNRTVGVESYQLIPVAARKCFDPILKPWLLGECFREKMIKGYGRRNRFVNRLLSIALSENSLP